MSIESPMKCLETPVSVDTVDKCLDETKTDDVMNAVANLLIPVNHIKKRHKIKHYSVCAANMTQCVLTNRRINIYFTCVGQLLVWIVGVQRKIN